MALMRLRWLSHRVALLIVIDGLILPCLGENILRHSLFIYDEGTGRIRPESNMRLHASVDGGGMNAGDEIVLASCQLQAYEKFRVEHGFIKVEGNTAFCVSVEGKLEAGSRIVTSPCGQHKTPEASEALKVDGSGHMRLSHKPDLCVTTKAEAQSGSELILGDCSGDANLFIQEGHGFKLAADRNLHLKVEGGDLREASPLVLSDCSPGDHESFDFTADGRLVVNGRPNYCVNSAAGVLPGHRLVLWPCGKEPSPNERFQYDPEQKLIFASENPKLVFNIASNAVWPGGRLVLWPYDDKV